MKKYDYLIVGGGMAADAAVKGIRELDKSGSIGMLCREAEPPYRRPPLSKDLWTGDTNVAAIDCGTSDYGVDILLGQSAGKLDPMEHSVEAGGNVYGYGRLLIATGGVPRKLPFQEEGVIYFRTLENYRNLRRGLLDGDHFGVVGAGFIGSEIAAVLATEGRRVTMVFPEETIGAGTLPPVVSDALSGLYEKNGVELMCGLKPSGLERDKNKLVLQLENGQKIEVDGVVAGLGIEPATELAKGSLLEINDGIVVNGMLQTRHSDIFAAGDVANFHSPLLNKKLRCEHEDNALSMGRMAGRNMTGLHERYDHLPFFYSDLFDVGYEAVGDLDANREIIGIWNGIHGKSVWAYLDQGKVCGVLLWNIFGKTDFGRTLIAQSEPWNKQELKIYLSRLVDQA